MYESTDSGKPSQVLTITDSFSVVPIAGWWQMLWYISSFQYYVVIENNFMALSVDERKMFMLSETKDCQLKKKQANSHMYVTFMDLKPT